MRQLTCSECGSVWRVLKEGTTGQPIDSFNCCAGRTKPRQTTDATILQFPAASERLGSGPLRSSDVTRRGDSSCRGVPRGPLGEVELQGPPDEPSVEL